ncbi:alpha/beta fold hydrolase [Stenotrophomonas maltophilia]|uniref:alpha/beta fold hydrolase n=1 Tax=Stenotrophomonas maltophilia TaxID=40324 RepID=UPI003BF8AAF9
MKDMASELRTRSVQVGQRQVFVAEKGAGHPVLMLHGGGPGASGLSNFSRNVDSLAAQFRVLVVDMPGYGQSSKGVNRSDPFGDLAEVMLGLLDALNIQSAHVIGNSLGGACGLRMALEAPDRVSGLILMGPGGVNLTRDPPTPGLTLLLDYYENGGPSLDKITTFIRKFLVFDGTTVSDEMINERYRSSIDPEVVAQPPLRRPPTPAAAARMDFVLDSRLKSCSVPTLVLWGAEDRVNRPSGGATLLKRMPNCDLYMFSRTGHWVQWERAEQFNVISASFLSLHTPRQ